MFSLFRTNYSVRTDGLYVFRLSDISPYGKPFKLTMFLVFNNHHRVIRADTEGFVDIDKAAIKDMLQELSDCTELSNECAEYFCDNEHISMKFINSYTHAEEFKGVITKDGLLLSRILHIKDLEGPRTKVTLQNMNFEFIKA
jgi:hypothetical protein